jgi:hypothetical protein
MVRRSYQINGRFDPDAGTVYLEREAHTIACVF